MTEATVTGRFWTPADTGGQPAHGNLRRPCASNILVCGSFPANFIMLVKKVHDVISSFFVVSYDSAGNILTNTDAWGYTTAYTSDDLHRQPTVTLLDPDVAGPLAPPGWESAWKGGCTSGFPAGEKTLGIRLERRMYLRLSSRRKNVIHWKPLPKNTCLLLKIGWPVLSLPVLSFQTKKRADQKMGVPDLGWHRIRTQIELHSPEEPRPGLLYLLGCQAAT